MIELLILHELNKKVLTMYGISKEIKSQFAVLTTPSYGTIKPALNRLEKKGLVKTQKTMSSGGRPSVYYSITSDGKEELKKLMLAEPLDNPIQFLPTARIKLACAEMLTNKEQIEMLKTLKTKSELIILDIKKNLIEAEQDFFAKVVYDNLLCEYKNFISLIEGVERACKN